MKKILKNCEGNAALFAIVIVLALSLLFSVVSEYLRLQIIASGVRDALESSVISVATENYADVYNGLREGYSGGYALNQSDIWEEQFTTGDVMANLIGRLGLVVGFKYVGDVLEYRLSDLEIQVLNTPFAPSGNGVKFESEAKITLEVSHSFGWEHLPPLRMRLKVRAGYTPKF
jgi:hypothetical protein